MLAELHRIISLEEDFGTLSSYRCEGQGRTDSEQYSCASFILLESGARMAVARRFYAGMRKRVDREKQEGMKRGSGFQGSLRFEFLVGASLCNKRLNYRHIW